MVGSIFSTRELSMGRLRLRVSPLVVLAVLAAMGGFLRLGIWQLDRAEQKIEEQVNLLDAQSREAMQLQHVPVAGRAFDLTQLQNLRVSLQGSYLNERSVYLVYQTHEEQIGYEIVTPFRLAANGDIAFVSRGWTAAAPVEAISAALPAIEGDVSVEGQIFVPRSPPKAQPAPSGEWPLVTRHLDIAALSGRFEGRVFPYVVRLAEGQRGVLVRHWPAVTANTQQHFSYALQWFAMALAVALTALFLASNLASLMRERLGPL